MRAVLGDLLDLLQVQTLTPASVIPVDLPRQ